MPKTIITHPDMPPPMAPYSQVVRGGGFLFVSGQAGIDPATGEAAGPDFEAQARQVFANLAHVLELSGAAMADVVKTTCWLANVEDAPRLGELFAEAFGIEPPARSTPIVALPRGLLLSIEAIAVCDGS